jgi:hypothetical protein
MSNSRIRSGAVLSVAIVVLGALLWTPAAAGAATCPCTIWSDSVTPAVPAANDGQPIEVGTKFRSDQPGDITGIRYYRGSGVTGTFVGHLWAGDGTQLAEVVFSGGATGWQTATLTTPVAIAADTTYVASYWSSDGYFAIDAGYFATTGLDNPPLHALQSGVDGVNGVYRYGASGFPTDGNTANYWADVVFQPEPVEPPGPVFVDTTSADFNAGALDSGTQVSDAGGGEVILLPTVGQDFLGDSLPGDWSATTWAEGSGGATVSNGQLVVDGARAGTNALFGPGRSLEFTATFASGTTFQHVGWGTTYEDAPWAMFSTGANGNSILARTLAPGGSAQDTDLGSAFIGSSHRFRIQWNTDSVDYFVDGNPVASHAATISDQMRPLASDFSAGGGTVSVDWVRVSPYAPTGNFVSRVFDASSPANWGPASWTAALPPSTSLVLSVRKGDTPVPDGSWTSFTVIQNSGDPVGGQSRYIQYRAALTTSDSNVAPALEDVTIEYEEAQPPSILSFTPSSGTVGTTVTVTGTAFTGTTDVAFNGTPAKFRLDSDTQIRARVPDGATTGPITITTAVGSVDSSGPFTVPPKIGSFSPTSGRIGTVVRITGSAFTGATSVQFNGTSATQFLVLSYKQIKVRVPVGATTGPITVVTPSGTATSARPFTVTG